VATQDSEDEDEDFEPLAVETQVAEAGPWAKSLTVTVPAETVTKEFEALTGRLAGSVQLRGFRQGKAPRNVVEKLYGQDIRKQVTANLIRRGFHSALLKEKLDVVGEPNLDLSKVLAEKGRPLAFSAQVEIKPAFELSNYKGLTIEQEEVEVLPEEIDENIQRVRDRFAEPVDAPPDHALGNKDAAKGVLRYTVDGNEVHKEEEAELLVLDEHVLGANAHLEAKFLEGAKAGEKRSTEAQLSERFPVAEQRGKKAALEFEVKSIRLHKLPPVDDALAQRMGAKTLDELKEKLRAVLLERLGEEIRRKTQYDLLDRVVAATPFDLPKRLQETMSHHTRERSLHYLAQLGIDAGALGEGRSRLESDAKEQATTEMRRYFVVDAICAKEDITVTDEDVDEEIVKLARSRNMRASELYDHLRDQGELVHLESGLKLRKALEFLAEQADIKIVPRKPRPKPKGHEGCEGHEQGSAAEAPAAAAESEPAPAAEGQAPAAQAEQAPADTKAGP